jgi:hypothetical protein
VDEDRLRTAYDLLRDVVQDLSDVGQPVRDSEIKRQMLKRDEQFDEGALGFRKFSRFLRQAHDEEIINLETGPEGNYLVSPLNGASAERTAPARAEPRRETRRQPDARAEPEAGPEPEARAETAAAARPDEAPGADAPAESPEHRTTRGLGRFRRGSRGRSTPVPSTKSDAPPIPGPVDAPASSGTSSAVAPTSAPESGDGAGDFRSEIEEMSRAYPGVGRRTAERLYAEFGADLLNVIDDQPHRITAILPEHRARAVIEGREAQRASRGD